MTGLKFADTHNLVVFLSKPAESEGFKQIVDFLNANPIRYALTINPTIYISCIEQFWSTVKAKTINRELQLHALMDGKKIMITESTVRRDLQLEDAEGVDCLPNSTIFEQLTLMGSKTTAWNEFSSAMASAIIYEAVYKELDDSLVRAATTASRLKVDQDSGNIAKTQSKATPNESSSLGTTLGGGPRCQETMGDTIAQTRFENVSKHCNDPLLARGNTLQSGEDSLKLNKLMELCTNLQTSVLDLEKTKTTQAEEIVSLKRRVKKLKQKKRSRAHGLKRINTIDVDEDIILVNDHDDVDMFDVNTLTSDEVLAKQEVATKDVNLTVDEVTLAQALAALKSVKPKVKANVVEEPSVPVSVASTKVSATTTTTTATIPTSRKGIVFTELGTSTTTTIISSQPSQVKVQDKGKEKMIEPKKPLKKKDQISLDKQEAIRLQAEFDKEERLAREKDEANVALTEEWDDIQAKVDADYHLDQRLQAKEQEQFTTEQKETLQKVDDVQETAKVDDDQEATKIKEPMKIVPDKEEVAIDAISLATKPPTIIDWKIHKEGKKNYYQIIRADGILKMYLVFSHMLKSFDREDFETLWKLVKAKYGSTRPVEDLDLILWGDLKTMFKSHVKDKVWRNQQDYIVLDWKLCDSCGVHSLRMQHMHIHMLVEKIYPLTPATITDMLNKKL
ncbi:hypothetical protein Tco_1210751 [Tanacetum coccineum]